MAQEEKAKAYDEAIKRAKDALNDGTISNNTIAYLQDVFPQLKESEDEKIRKNLIAFLEDIWHLGKNANFDKWGKSDCSDWIIWLEKQGEQKSAWSEDDENEYNHILKILNLLAEKQEIKGYNNLINSANWLKSIKDRIRRESKFYNHNEKSFNNADNDDPKTEISKDTWYICTSTTCSEDSRIWLNKGTAYLGTDILKYDLGFEPVEYQNYFRLWTIEDAKDGDVLSYVTDEGDLWLMIYWSLYKPYEGHVHYHALLVDDVLTDKGTCCICIDNLKPATKEQRDLLEKAMTDARYTFDFNKKNNLMRK